MSQILNTKSSIWLTANAGTGKTFSLVSRYLKLLLEGSHVKNILCLTFTNAAAFEMQQRIINILRNWNKMYRNGEKEQLKTTLKDLFHYKEISEELCIKAAKLFYDFIDNEQDQKISTIHAFCYKTLETSSIEELDLDPSKIKICDEQQRNELIKDVTEYFISNHWKHNEEEFYHFTPEDLQNDITKSVTFLVNYDFNLRNIIKESINQEDFSVESGGNLKINSIEQALQEIILLTPQITILLNTINLLESYGVLARNALEKMLYFSKKNTSLDLYDLYKFFDIFLTQKLEPRKKIWDKKFTENYPDFVKDFETLSKSAYNIADKYAIFYNNAISYSLNLVGQYSRTYFNSLKKSSNLIDYQDMLAYAKKILETSDAKSYHIISEIKHILVDEAQDNNQEQWDIIRLIADEILNIDNRNTIFVVGDNKQSIYSFQGANPDLFQKYGKYYQNYVSNIGGEFHYEKIETTYRNPQKVVNLVNKLFNKSSHIHQYADEYLRESRHICHKKNTEGEVKIHPLIVSQEAEENIIESATIQITNLLKDLFEQKKFLHSKNRDLQYSDIMILVETRQSASQNGLMSGLLKQLRRNNIPAVADEKSDLSNLTKVRDIMSILYFLEDNSDDFSLASLLKSPLFNFTDQDLLDIIHSTDQKLSLWDKLNISDSPAVPDLNKLREKAKILNSFDLAIYITKTYLKLYEGSYEYTESKSQCEAFLSIFTKIYDNETPNLLHILDLISAGEYQFTSNLHNDETINAIKIRTAHQSKGREAPIVIIVSCNNYTAQVRRDNYGFIEDIYRSRLHKLDIVEESFAKRQEKLLQERLRLLYVMLTRSSEELHVFGIDTKFNEESSTPKYSFEQSFLYSFLLDF